MNGLYILRILTCVLVADKTIGQWASTGTPHSFTVYTANKDEPTILWSLKNKTEGSEIKLFQCSRFNGVCLQSEDKFLELYTANLTHNESTFTSVLTIKSVNLSQHNTTWLSTVNRKNLYDTEEYNLYVFDAPESPTCDDVTLTNENSIHISCVTQKVFPRSVCLFYFITNESTPAEVKNGHINYKNEQDATTGYYKTTCSYTMFAGFLGPGTHLFYVVMYSDITSTIYKEMKKNSGYTTPILISYPEALLASDCKVNGYIKENETGQCTCYNNYSSLLPTYITWSTGGIKIDRKSDTMDLALNFTARRPSDVSGNQSFTCIITNTLNWTHTIAFQPNVAYPPSTINLSIPEQKLTICTDLNVNISGSCLISESNPKPSVSIYINNILIKPAVRNSLETMFTTASSTGLFNISCIATSDVFYTTTSKSVTIRGPPAVPKIFKDTNHRYKDVLQVTDEETLTCESSGGYPPSKILTLKCGNDTKYAFDLDQVELTLNKSHFTYAPNLTCECIVWHETQCPHNRTTIQVEFLVSGVDTDQEYGLQNIQIAIGVAVACSVIIIILIIIIFTIRIGQIKLRSSGLPEKLVENGDLYFIRDEKFSTDMSLYPEYTNVVTTMASAMEAPKNLKKQA